MEHLTVSTLPMPFSGEDWFDPLEEAVRFQVRASVEALVEEEVQGAPGGHKRYQRKAKPKGYRNDHRDRQLAGTFGALTVALPAPGCSTNKAGRTNGGAKPSRPTSG